MLCGHLSPDLEAGASSSGKRLDYEGTLVRPLVVSVRAGFFISLNMKPIRLKRGMGMNSKAEKFKAYLEEKKIEGVFQIEDRKDEMEVTLFSSRLDINGNALPALVIFDRSNFATVRVIVAPKVMSEENQLEVFKLIDSYNRRFKLLKYYIDEAGSLILDISLIFGDDDSSEKIGEIVYAMLLNFITPRLTESYKDIMRAVWASAPRKEQETAGEAESKE